MAVYIHTKKNTNKKTAHNLTNENTNTCSAVSSGRVICRLYIPIPIMILHIEPWTGMWHFSLWFWVAKWGQKNTTMPSMVDYIWVAKFHLSCNWIFCVFTALHSKWRPASLFTDTVIWFPIKKACSVIQPHTQPERFHSSAICHLLLPWLQ